MNVIFVTCDEKGGDAPAFMGDLDGRTPRLDGRVERVVLFLNRFDAHGKCVPNRAAMRTGRCGHTDGYRTIDATSLTPPGAPNPLTAWKAAGYETACFGHNRKRADMCTHGMSVPNACPCRQCRKFLNGANTRA